MKVLLTGGTGLIGQAVGKELVKCGHTVRVLTRNPQPSNLNFPCEVVSWKAGEEALDLRNLEGVNAIIHLAGESIADGRWTKQRKLRIYNSRIESTQALTVAAEKSLQLSVFILGSAMGIYGDCGERELHESDLPGTDFLARLCVDWEAALGNKQEIRKVMIRTGLVLARNGGALAKMLGVFKMGLGGCLGDGRQWMSWIHLDDLARLFVFALESGDLSGAVHGSAPYPVRNSDFTIALARVLEKHMGPPVPRFILRIVLGEMASSVLASIRLSYRRVLAAGFEFKFEKLDEALLAVFAEKVPSKNQKRT